MLACCLLAAVTTAGQEIRRLPTPPELLPATAAADATPIAAAEDAHSAAPPAEPAQASPAPEAPAAEAPAETPPAAAPAAADLPADPHIADLIPNSSDDALVTPVAHWYQPSYWFGPAPWDTGVEFGLNGSSGSGDSLSTRSGGYLKRKTATGKLDTKLFHNRTKSEGRETQNNARLDLRYDWLLGDTPWSLYGMNQTFYDRYQAFDLNVNLNAGLGYQVFDADFVKFGTSFGAGATRKFGGKVDEWEPEAQMGMAWEQRVTDSQRFIAKLDYFPKWADFNNYRMVSDLSWEIDLDKPSNVSLKLSLADRFDSNSDGVNPHNTNYSVLLLWKK
ncbi:hypothetical protein Pla123a_33060 [Posidoniimonas polymericola]|uniref:DUF481 domain-containing protein n=2 Tax=Posidoniimonas polymericola TaxID=2528002 RepID=A0A5C5YHB1_9BACT|nr:hypothetical protein Pla123a_33060 [Posidoniimonas polymericola]